MNMSFFEKEPGVYITEAASPAPTPSGVATGICAMFGVTQWGPLAPALFQSFSDWQAVYGGYISKTFPSYKQVKKFFKNGGKNLYFQRIVHFTNFTSLTSKTSVQSSGNLLDNTGTAAIVASATAGTNTGDVTVASSMSPSGYSGVSGAFRVVVSTAGAFGAAVVTIFFKPTAGTEVTVGTVVPTSGVAFSLNNGALLAITKGASGNLALNDSWTVNVTAAGLGATRYTVKGKFDGVAGDSNVIKVVAAGSGITGEVKILVSNPILGQSEVFDNLSPDKNATNYICTVINSKSKLIAIEDSDSNVKPLKLSTEEAPFVYTLTGGNDGITGLVPADYAGDETLGLGMHAFDLIANEQVLVGCPDADVSESKAIRESIAVWIEDTRQFFDHIVIAPFKTVYTDLLKFQNETLALDVCRSYLYGTWLIDEDDGEVVSPLGGIMGLYVRYAEDAQKGIWWSPSGQQARLYGYSGVANPFNPTHAGKLNENRINLIKSISGAGLVVWGSRTMTISKQKDFRYIGQRRNTTNLELMVFKNTQWAPHLPYDAELFIKLNVTVNDILEKRFRQGGLDGANSGEAYSIQCTEKMNSQHKADNDGVLEGKIGIRNKGTMEFLWFSFFQMASGSGSVSE